MKIEKKAIVRRALPTAAGIAAAMALAVAGASACSSPGGTELIVSGEAPEPQQGSASAAASTPNTADSPHSPGKSTGVLEQGSESRGLAWTETDLSRVFASETRALVKLESTGDGRVLAISSGPDGHSRLLTTENGTDWAEVELPANLELQNADIAGNRWVVQGRDSASDAPEQLVLISDDKGAAWTALDIDLQGIGGLVVVVDAMASGKQVLVVASSFPAPPDYSGSSDAAKETEPGEGSVHILSSDGGPAQQAAELSGWYAGGFGASDGFYLLLSGTSEEYAMFSPDGREWVTSNIDRDRSNMTGEVIWVNGRNGGQSRSERFDGVYGPEQVLAHPEGMGGISDLAVGPPGVAAVGWPSNPYTDSGAAPVLPEVSIEKDGFELRYNQPPGGITLWDAAEGAAVYVLEVETLENDGPPQGIREIETDDGSLTLVFDDPDSGEELVSYSDEELTAAFFDTASAHEAGENAFEIFESQVGWSEDGVEWVWQSSSEAFGVPEPAQGFAAITEVDVAVGGDFVIAKTQTSEFPTTPPVQYETGGADSSAPAGAELPGQWDYNPPPSRWFIAKVG